MEARIQKYIWLALFVISLVIFLLVFTFGNFTTDTTLNKNSENIIKNAASINLTKAEVEEHNRQTKIVTDRQEIIMDSIANNSAKLSARQDKIMTIVNGDVAYLKDQFKHDLYYDKIINQKADLALNMGKEINNKLNILLGNNTQ